MAILQFNDAIRDARMNAIESTTGTGPRLQFYTGSPPASCAAAATGTLLADFTLPSDWMSASASGTKTKLGTWGGVGLPAAGAGLTIGYFRLIKSTTVYMQGDVTTVGGGGAMTIDSTTLASGQPISVATFTLIDGHG